MSLLKKPELNTRWRKLLLVIVAVLLLVPCAAAATLAMRFDVQTNAQDPAAQEKQETKERKEREKIETKMRMGGELELKRRLESDPQFREEFERKEKLELELQSLRQATLVRLAKINMDQAIQIATSQQPGKVLYCSLDANHWEAPGKLASDGFVFYRVVIANEADGGQTNVLVNAVDGTIITVNKEGLRRRSLEP